MYIIIKFPSLPSSLQVLLLYCLKVIFHYPAVVVKITVSGKFRINKN